MLARTSSRGRKLIRIVVSLSFLFAALPAPVSAADEQLRERDSIVITANHEFNPANGVRSGSGSKRDPFVISGWRVGNVLIRDTSAYYVVRGNEVTGALTLNWTGKKVRVVKNAIHDLRVNQNVERAGRATSGLIAGNSIAVVGQLRHFDGRFQDNVVGELGMLGVYPSGRAVNFHGFNGARFRDNVIYGYMDATLHGHHHSSGFKGGSHQHRAPRHDDEAAHEGHRPPRAGMHAHRFHRVSISGNRIYSSAPWALRYTDTNHAGNDRTAASETNEALNLPHVHHTRVQMDRNKLFGSGLYVDVFNAEDENHRRIARGTVRLRRNTVSIERSATDLNQRNGITVQRAQGIRLRIARNKVSEVTSDMDDLTDRRANDIGIWLNDFDRARIHILGNQVADTTFGVRAANFSESVHWWVGGLKVTRVQEDIYYDNSVANHPRTR